MSGSEKPELNDALAVGRALDLTLPDSHAVQEAYAQAKAESSPWLFNHVARSWLFGAKLAQHRALNPVPSWLPSRCFCTISALLAVALRIVASRSSERTPTAPSPSRMTWGDRLLVGNLVNDVDDNNLNDIERIDRLTTIAESRRNASLREIDRRRAVLGAALRRNVQEIEEGEYKVIEASAGARFDE